MENIKRVEIDTAIHIPTGYRLSIHAMSELMNRGDKCLYKIDDNMFLIGSMDIFENIESGAYNLVGVEYEAHMYEYDVASDATENIILEPIDMWDEYSEWVEYSI